MQGDKAPAPPAGLPEGGAPSPALPEGPHCSFLGGSWGWHRGGSQHPAWPLSWCMCKGGGHNRDHCTLLGLNNPPTAPRLSLGACTGLSTTVSCSASCAHARARHICTPVTRVCAYVPTAMHRYVHVHQACVHTDATLKQANTRLCVQKCPAAACRGVIHATGCTRVHAHACAAITCVQTHVHAHVCTGVTVLCASTHACTRSHTSRTPVCKHRCFQRPGKIDLNLKRL